MSYADSDTVIVQSFSRQSDGSDIIIGRVDLGIYLAVPEDAVWLLDLFAAGSTLLNAKTAYYSRYGEVLDLNDFLETMASSRFLQVATGAELALDTQPTPRTTSRAYHFSNISQATATRIFSKPSLFASVVLCMIAITGVILDRGLLPHPRDLYFSSFRSLSFGLLILEGYFALFLHELAHLVAARSVGVGSRMALAHRLWFLVAETDLTELWRVPKEKRYLPLLAGPLIDAVSASLLILSLYWNQHIMQLFSPFWYHLVKAIVFACVMRLVWQSFLFVRTDFYYVITSMLSCRSLMADTELYLKDLLSSILPFFPRQDLTRIPRRELGIIKAYSVVWMAGRAVSLWLLTYVMLDVALRYTRGFIALIHGRSSVRTGSVWDFVLFAVSSLMPLILGVGLWIRTLIRGDKAQLAT